MLVIISHCVSFPRNKNRTFYEILFQFGFAFYLSTTIRSEQNKQELSVPNPKRSINF